ncbi:unnamed protein product [Trichobilharzia regenti]|nr:unnamed protein product [Trichobilharzia regenti]
MWVEAINSASLTVSAAPGTLVVLTRMLSKMAQEHNVTWLQKCSNGSIRSAIIKHPVNTDHSISTNTSFQVIYKVAKNNLPKTIPFRLICTAETLAIQQVIPELCIKKKKIIRSLLPS